MKELAKIDSRNYGIDLLRIVSMFFIVLLHSFGHGGLLDGLDVNSTQYKAVYFFEISAYCAVNIFGIISGYVSYNSQGKKVKFSNLLKLWAEVVFYGIIISLVAKIIEPSLVTKTDMIKQLIPVCLRTYWYFTSYVGLFILMPFINNSLTNMSEKTAKKILVLLIIVFSVVGTIFEPFILNGGYSVAWLCILYIIGLVMKKCELGKNLKSRYGIVAILILTLISYIYAFKGHEINILEKTITNRVFESYISPTVLGIAIFYVIIFSKMKFGNIIKRIIKFSAPSAFAIYIINEHPIIRENIITGMFTSSCNQGTLIILAKVFLFVITFVVGVILIDKIRQLIFEKCKINYLCDKIVKKLEDI